MDLPPDLEFERRKSEHEKFFANRPESPARKISEFDKSFQLIEEILNLYGKAYGEKARARIVSKLRSSRDEDLGDQASNIPKS